MKSPKFFETMEVKKHKPKFVRMTNSLGGNIHGTNINVIFPLLCYYIFRPLVMNSGKVLEHTQINPYPNF